MSERGLPIQLWGAGVADSVEQVRSRSLRTAERLTTIIVVLAVAASGAGLLVPGLYHETAWIVPQVRGQDLVTLCVVCPALVIALVLVHRGSSRGALGWIGLLGYIAYTYTGASFAYAINQCFPIYVALFSLSIAALIAAARGIDVAALARAFDEAAPRRAVVGFLVALALLLSVLWLGQIVPFLLTGKVPKSIELSGGPTMFVYVLDLGVVVPVALVAAVWLWRRRPWGYLLAAFILLKSAAMGLSLISMSWFARRAGQPLESGLAVVWLAIALAGVGMSAWYLRHCHSVLLNASERGQKERSK